MKKSELKKYIKENIIETLTEEEKVNEETYVGKDSKPAIKTNPKFSRLPINTRNNTLKTLDKGESVTLEQKIESFNIGDKVSFNGLDGEPGTGVIISAKFKVKVNQGGPEMYFDSENPEDVKKMNENLNEDKYFPIEMDFYRLSKILRDFYHDSYKLDLKNDYNLTTFIDKFLEKTLGSEITENINEMARRAVLVTLGDKKKADKVKKAYEGKWMAKMIDNVIAAGKDGISQPALAASIDKQQQAINTPVKQLIDAGVFKIVGDSPKKDDKTSEPKNPEPKNSVKPKSEPKEKDDEDVEVKDDWEKGDDEAKTGGDDEEDLDKQATTGAAKISGKAAKLDQAIRDLKNVEEEMKTLANQYKTAEGKDREKIVADLKSKTQIKKELEKLRDSYANQIV